MDEIISHLLQFFLLIPGDPWGPGGPIGPIFPGGPGGPGIPFTYAKLLKHIEYTYDNNNSYLGYILYIFSYVFQVRIQVVNFSWNH